MTEYMLKTFNGKTMFVDFDDNRNLADQLCEMEVDMGVAIVKAEVVA